MVDMLTSQDAARTHLPELYVASGQVVATFDNVGALMNI
jgi:hypothetical protein